MRAIIIATGHAPELESMNEPRPVSLLPLIDRPFIQHLIEYLVDQGITEFDFVLSHLPEKFEELLGDGSRWGSQFRYHLARDAARPYRLLKSLETGGNPILLAHADRLPQVRLDQVEPAHESGPAIFVTPLNSGSESGWTGWAWLPASLFASLPAGPHAWRADLSAARRPCACQHKLPAPLYARSVAVQKRPGVHERGRRLVRRACSFFVSA